jgi:hypothetical protein
MTDWECDFCYDCVMKVWRSIQAIKECDDVEMLCLTFTHSDESFGGRKTVELKPGGKQAIHPRDIGAKLLGTHTYIYN